MAWKRVVATGVLLGGAVAAFKSPVVRTRLQQGATEIEHAFGTLRNQTQQKLQAMQQDQQERAEQPAKQAKRQRRERVAGATVTICLLVLALLAAAGASVAAVTLNWAAGHVQAAVQAATGRAMTVAGPVRWSLMPPRLDMHDVALANLPDGSRPAMVTAPRIKVFLAAWPLLVGAVRVDGIYAESPDVFLERTATGSNWRFHSALTGGVGASHLFQSRGWRVASVGGVLHLPALFGGGPELIQLDTINLHEGGVLHASGALKDGVRFAGLAALSDEAIWPISGSLDGNGGSHASMKGSVAPATGAWTMQFNGSAPDLGSLPGTRWAGVLPPLNDLQAYAELSGTGLAPAMLRGFQVRAGGADWGALLPGLILQQATVVLPNAGGPAAVSASASLQSLPMRLYATVLPATPAAGTFTVRDVHLESPLAEMRAEFRLHMGDRPALDGSVEAVRLDLNRIIEAIRQAEAPKPDGVYDQYPPDTAPSPPDSAAGSLFSSAPLPFEGLLRADAALTLRFDQIALGGAVWGPMVTPVVLRSGRLHVGPVLAGSARGELSVDAAANPPAVALSLQAPAMALSPVLAALGQPAVASGTLTADAHLHSAGTTIGGLAAGLDGTLRLSLKDGAIRAYVIEALRKALSPDATVQNAASVPLHEAVLALQFNIGQAEASALRVKTPGFRLSGSGGLDLRDETVGLRLREGDGTIFDVRGPSGETRARIFGGFTPVSDSNNASAKVLHELMRGSVGEPE